MGDDGGSGRLPEAGEAVVEELVMLVLDRLVPSVGWYRDQVAHRIGVSPAALTVLEQARHSPTTASRCAGWTTMTPSAMAKVVRKLEACGHVTRSPSGDHEQELFVERLPHPERDRLESALRDSVRWAMRHLVSSFGLADPGRHLVAANTIVHACTALSVEAAHLRQHEEDRRLLVRRRKARAAAGIR